MKKNVFFKKMFYLLQLLFVVSIITACNEEAIEVTDYGTFKKIELNFRGKSSEEIGVAYGEWLKENYPNFIADYTTYYITLKTVLQQQYSWPSDEEIEQRVSYLSPNIPQNYKDELLGISKGLGDSSFYEILLKLNLVPDILRPVACSSFAIYGNKSSSGQTIMARNLEWWSFNILNKYASIVKYKNQKGKKDFVNIGYMGITSIISGINETEIGIHIQDVGINTMLPYDGERYSYTYTIREALENATSSNEALEIFRSRNFVYSFNMLFFDEEKAFAYERSVEKGNGSSYYSIRTPMLSDVRTEWNLSDRIAVTNHYESNSMDSLQYYYNVDSVDRYVRIRDLLSVYSEEVTFTVENAKKIISNNDGENKIYKSVEPGAGEYYGTQESYIYDCSRDTLYFFAAESDGITEPEYTPLNNLF